MRSAKYLSFVRTLPCSICEHPGPSQAHHGIDIGMGGIMGGKPSDLFTMPVCGGCHAQIHRSPKADGQRFFILQTIKQALEAGELKL